jgi:hypothetical protein
VYLDPTTTAATTVETSFSVNTILPYMQVGSSAKKALLLDLNGGSRTATFTELEEIETKGSQALTDRPLLSTPTHADLLEQGFVALTCTGSGTALVVVNLADKSSSSIVGNTQLKNVTLDSHAPSHFWGAISGTKLTSVSLTPTGVPAEVWLDQAITSIIPLPLPSSDGKRYLIIGHNDPSNIGNITVLDADTPSRESARTAHGFLLSNYLERGQP